MKPGDRVTMTKEALDQKLDGKLHRTKATVISCDKYTVRVLRRGMKQRETWSKSFWKKLI